MTQFGPVFGDLLVVKDPCCGDGDTFFEKGTVESPHGTVDGGAKHGGLGHCLSVGFGRSTRAYIMVFDSKCTFWGTLQTTEMFQRVSHALIEILP